MPCAPEAGLPRHLAAKDEQIIAVPTLIKKLPLPLRRFIGSMADVERILVGLDVKSLSISKQRAPLFALQGKEWPIKYGEFLGRHPARRYP